MSFFVNYIVPPSISQENLVINWNQITNKPNFADPSWKGIYPNRLSAPLVGNTLGDTIIIIDDGDGKGALYTCYATTGLFLDQWAKQGDVDFANPEWNSILNVPIDNNLITTSINDDTIPSAKATKTYADTKAKKALINVENGVVTQNAVGDLVDAGYKNNQVLNTIGTDIGFEIIRLSNTTGANLDVYKQIPLNFLTQNDADNIWFIAGYIDSGVNKYNIISGVYEINGIVTSQKVLTYWSNAYLNLGYGIFNLMVKDATLLNKNINLIIFKSK